MPSSFPYIYFIYLLAFSFIIPLEIDSISVLDTSKQLSDRAATAVTCDALAKTPSCADFVYSALRSSYSITRNYNVKLFKRKFHSSAATSIFLGGKNNDPKNNNISAVIGATINNTTNVEKTDNLNKKIDASRNNTTSLPLFSARRSHRRSNTNYTDNDKITLVSYFSQPFVYTSPPILKSWTGPIVWTFYGTSQQLDQILLSSVHFAKRKNLRIHLVESNSSKYFPSNVLRNVALESVTAGYAYVVDIDTLLPLGSYELLKNLLAQAKQQLNSTLQKNDDRVMYIVPTFQSLTGKKGHISYIPRDKSDLLERIKNGEFHPRGFTANDNLYKPNNDIDYPRWYTATQVYEKTNITTNFEEQPVYKIPPKSSSPLVFDENFVGRGGNKKTQNGLALALGYKFFILPDIFTIHLRHEFSTAKHQAAEYDARQCMCKEFFMDDYKCKLKKINKTQKFLQYGIGARYGGLGSSSGGVALEQRSSSSSVLRASSKTCQAEE